MDDFQRLVVYSHPSSLTASLPTHGVTDALVPEKPCVIAYGGFKLGSAHSGVRCLTAELRIEEGGRAEKRGTEEERRAETREWGGGEAGTPSTPLRCRSSPFQGPMAHCCELSCICKGHNSISGRACDLCCRHSVCSLTRCAFRSHQDPCDSTIRVCCTGCCQWLAPQGWSRVNAADGAQRCASLWGAQCHGGGPCNMVTSGEADLQSFTLQVLRRRF